MGNDLDLEDDPLEGTEGRSLARIARPQAETMPPLALRGLGTPSASTSPSPSPVPIGSTSDLENRGLESHIAARPIATPSPLEQRTTNDQAELDRLQTTGSGISQIKNPFGRVALRGLETIGNILAPRTTSMIPGTEGHHQQLIGQQRGRIGEDQEEAARQATVEETGAKTDQANAAAEKDRADATAKLNPPDKEGLTPEERTIHDLMTGNNGAPRMNPQTQKPYTYLEAYQAMNQAKQDAKPTKAERPDTPEQQLIDAEAAVAAAKSPEEKTAAQSKVDQLKRSLGEYGAATQKPEREPKQLAVTPDGTVVELRPGMKVPAGTRTLGSELKGPTADEQRRADLASNMNENLDKLEDILTRRPELFGKVAGRVTGLREMVGTSDDDVAALKTIEEQMGMAMVGAHAMRNAGHVETAARAVTNGFHNSPEAIKHAIQVARESLATFQKDAGQQPSTGATAPPAVGEIVDGYKFKGGNPADQASWEKVTTK